MSALTKLFVVLLVVVSLLLSASLVVFVNRTENYREASVSVKHELDKEQGAHAVTKIALAAANADRVSQVNELNTRVKEGADQLTASQKKVDDVSLQLAQSQSNEAVARTNIAHLSQAVQAAQEQTKSLEGVVADVRSKNDDLVKKSFELNTSISDLSSKNTALGRQLTFLTEQNSELQTENQRMKPLVQDSGSKGGNGGSGGVAGVYSHNLNSTPINGVVTKVESIAGNVYATISVGSSSNVTKGMQFNAVDRNTGDFLGFVTVDTVEPESATGHIEGPRKDRIRNGIEVRTQLQ